MGDLPERKEMTDARPLSLQYEERLTLDLKDGASDGRGRCCMMPLEEVQCAKEAA